MRDSVLERYALAYIKKFVVAGMFKGFYNFVMRKTPQIGVRKILTVCIKDLMRIKI